MTKNLPALELALLQQTVRGQVHSLNNLMTTIEFAIQTLVPKESQSRFSALTKDVVAELADLRAIAAPPGATGRSGPPSLARALNAALRIAKNAPNTPTRMTLDDFGHVFLDPDDSWFITRAICGLLTALDRSQCSAIRLQTHEDAFAEIVYQLSEDKDPRWSESLAFTEQFLIDAGGQIHIESAPQERSIRVEIPESIVIIPTHIHEQAKQRASSFKPRSLLVIDDDLNLRIYFEALLKSVGIQATFAINPTEALDKLNSAKPDAALIDINLGDANGFDVAKALKESSDLPIIMMSGDEASKESAQKLEEVKALGYLVKPFAIDELQTVFQSQKTKD
ncbi:MAG: response regulator [Planctomycetota bacterium]|nr:response regulator [Planctomycetota bacterium]